MRLYPTTETVPKPLVNVGEMPIIWQIMKYYSHFGHNDFVFCLGYKAETIKKFFLNYDECLSSDFILSDYGRSKKLINEQGENWRITFVDTGLNSNIGQRLKAVQKYLDNDEMFLANYSDGVTNLHLPDLIDFFVKSKKTACVLSVKPYYSYHIISANRNGIVTKVKPLTENGVNFNGGYFAFKKEIFNYIQDGEDLVNEPFQRLIEKQELITYKFNGFWSNMDTFKDKQQLDELASNGKGYWQVWKNQNFQK